MHGLFITGTDTGVGKTRIGTTLAHCLVERGVRVRARKPVESDCPRGENGLRPQDALALHEAVSVTEIRSMDNATDLEHWLARPVTRVPHQFMSASGAPAWVDLAPYLEALAKRLVVE